MVILSKITSSPWVKSLGKIPRDLRDGAPKRIRTSDLRIRSPLRYPLFWLNSIYNLLKSKILSVYQDGYGWELMFLGVCESLGKVPG